MLHTYVTLPSMILSHMVIRNKTLNVAGSMKQMTLSIFKLNRYFRDSDKPMASLSTCHLELVVWDGNLVYFNKDVMYVTPKYWNILLLSLLFTVD